MTRPMVRLAGVDIVFGDRPASALAMMDAGHSRAEIQAETGQILGVHACTLDVAEGEILVLMGLSGSGKSTLLRAVNGLNRVVRGSVTIETGSGAVEVTTAGARRLRAIRRDHIAMEFQQFGLLPWRTCPSGWNFPASPRPSARPARWRSSSACSSPSGRTAA